MSPLLAYIDPGLGSLLIQGVLALVLGSGIMFRRFFAAPIRFLRRAPDESANSPND